MAVVVTEHRPQAGPLPSKRGEIGYSEDRVEEVQTRAESPQQALPERHPADRDHLPPPPQRTSRPLASSTPSPHPTGSSSPSPSPAPPDNKTTLLSRFKRRKLPSIHGFGILTLFLAFVQLALIGTTIVGWIFSLKLLNKQNNDFDKSGTGGSANIFIHILFTVAIIGQMIMFERRIFHLRAERYTYLHPGQMLPTYRTSTSSTPPSMGLAPWNRPPLPTYAATLAASGYGTGDVEDHIIAAPPPPAYGNTRGSVLLLSGFLRSSLRAGRPLSVHSESSDRERPKSYVSTDEQWEEICDAERACQLEVTLACLENGIVIRPPSPVMVR